MVSVDVETDWGGRLAPCRENLQGVYQGLPHILTILEKQQIPATLFVTGEIAPLIKSELQNAVRLGCKIASHGYTHRHFPELSSGEIQRELADSKAILEDVSQQPIQGFRAPQARIPENLNDKLAKHGYFYDSSVFGGKMPTRFDNRRVSLVPYLWGEIWEIPVSQLPLFPLPWGLLWVDLLTLSSIKLASIWQPLPSFIHIYLHPFDLIPAYRVTDVPWGAKLWYTRRPGSASQTLQKLLAFLQAHNYRFLTPELYLE